MLGTRYGTCDVSPQLRTAGTMVVVSPGGTPIADAGAHLRESYPQPPTFLADSRPNANHLGVRIRILPRLFSAVLAAALLVGTPAPARAAPGDRLAPLPGPVLRGFAVGEANWEPGHRGVDLAGAAGETVRAAAAGEVAWVGVIDGVPMLSVQHPDGLRTTYQPVTALLPADTQVGAGEPIGVLVAGHCAVGPCLHWGLRDGDRYLDPLAWLAAGSDAEVRLLPRDALPRALPPPGGFEEAELGAPPLGGLPVAGPITSPWGSRINPISGAPEFHDGVDIGAACGLPVRTLAGGVVSFAGSAGGYGLRVEVDHGGGRSTSYSHLSSLAVGAGQQVGAGAVVGLVGSTGYSTGCHLHYSLTVGGQSVNPMGGG